MLNFPVPYPDELLYSTVARAGVRFGITSPKQLLDAVFSDRKVVATIDLPSHIDAISKQYPVALGLTAENLVYKHTLFPLYAPFIPEDRRLAVLDWMTHRPQAPVHVALGVTTSRIRQPENLRVCPQCLEEQLSEHGELYWIRQWQVPGCSHCLKHGALCDTQYKLQNYHRHAYVALTPTMMCLPSNSNSPHNEKRIEKRVKELLALPPARSPSLEQWSLFYAQIAHATDITRKSKVSYDLLKHKVLSSWTPQHLAQLGIPVTDHKSNWLRLFMRKHRKSHSFLQHIVVLEALLGAEWNFEDVISQVRKQIAQNVPVAYSPSKNISQSVLHAKRKAWLEMVKEQGTRKSRKTGGDHIYCWLYRNDRNWLNDVNNKYRRATRSENRRVDWNERDRMVLERLKAIKREHANKLEDPRRSTSWYLAQSGCRHLSRKLGQMPLSATFLENNSEDVASHQIRRVIRAIIDHDSPSGEMSYSKLLRLSGLSEQRMYDRTRQFLHDLGWSR
ncbi:TnsD family Tn7-like transposition protein [uncultured Pseudodesulfovibrio sp.]|uniref:TnsD family Tn7-like transposition protein n=1 Tax=uncultured Pseudodesulfovibrio sp. TaxID=2035858 RepID=UPI0029C63B01|nr:TnsD family Tn7-like transposition protein [uncultured Pseudodesulfovibrio sp.]